MKGRMALQLGRALCLLISLGFVSSGCYWHAPSAVPQRSADCQLGWEDGLAAGKVHKRGVIEPPPHLLVGKSTEYVKGFSDGWRRGLAMERDACLKGWCIGCSAFLVLGAGLGFALGALH
jgi:hypothetical protein